MAKSSTFLGKRWYKRVAEVTYDSNYVPTIGKAVSMKVFFAD